MTNLEQHPRMNPYGGRYIEPKTVQKKLRKKALHAIRMYGKLTHTLRESPDYLIIGTKRGGTTSLAKWLTQHPEVSPLFPARETRKGMYYFDVNYIKGESWYKSHFPTKIVHKKRKKGETLLLGDATPYYLYHPHAAIRARRLVPNAKVIVLLRNPIERAFSHWVERTRQEVEHLSFTEAIKAEPGRLKGEEEKMLKDPTYTSFSHQHYSYVDQGRYAKSLQRWMDAYPKDQLLILRSEDLYAEPDKTYKNVLDFLGLCHHETDSYSAWNKKKKPTMDEATRTELEKTFSEEIQAVEKLTERKMDWT